MNDQNFKFDDIGLNSLHHAEGVVHAAAASAHNFVQSLAAGLNTDLASALFEPVARFYAAKLAGKLDDHPLIKQEAEAALAALQAELKKKTEPGRKSAGKKTQATVQQEPVTKQPDAQED